MGREIRYVTADWEPHEEPLHDGLTFPARLADWVEAKTLFDQGLRKDYHDETKTVPHNYSGSFDDWYGECPDPADYTTIRPGADLTHMVMYENTSEGSPLSPAFPIDQPEELAQWLEDNNASAFGSQGASKEAWLAMIQRGGYVSSMVMTPEHGVMSGVEYALVAAQEATHDDP